LKKRSGTKFLSNGILTTDRLPESVRWHGRILGGMPMSDAQDRGWGPPPCPRERIVDIFPGGLSRALPVHERVAGIFTAFVDELAARTGYRVEGKQQDDWGYAPRHIKDNPSLPWSNHAWGLAVDINAPANPNKAPLTTNMPAWVREPGPLMNKYGLRWGGHFSTPDPMHFEFMLRPEDADRITKQLGVGPALVPGGLSTADRRAILARMEAIYDALREGSATNVNSMKHVRDHIGRLETKLDALQRDVGTLQQPTG
jgi:D-alanyl-D-alanine carboxypeptidase